MIAVIFIVILAIYFLIAGKEKRAYKKSNYRKESGNKYSYLKNDKGAYGEYLIFNKLESIKGYHKIMTNIYIPGYNGYTAEIDLIFIHETGIYVIESKNYSGLICGDEASKFWTEAFESGKEIQFYSPVWQNSSHIKYLMRFLNLNYECFGSIIAFSQNCTLKRININSENIEVITIDYLVKTINKIAANSVKIFSREEIEAIYQKLKPFTRVSKSVKKQHVKNIKKNIAKN